MPQLFLLFCYLLWISWKCKQNFDIIYKQDKKNIWQNFKKINEKNQKEYEDKKLLLEKNTEDIQKKKLDKIKLVFLYDIIENKEAIILEEEIINKILNNFKKITSSQLSSNDTFNLIMAPYYKKYIIESFEYFINIIIFMEQNEAKKIREIENKNSIEKQNLKDSLTNMKLDLTNKIEYLQNEKNFWKKKIY